MITLLIFHRYILAIIFQMQDQAAENHFSQSEEKKNPTNSFQQYKNSFYLINSVNKQNNLGKIIFLT